MMVGPQKETFRGTEVVQRKVDGLALLVEGKFTNSSNVVLHETLAVISYNPKTSVFDFNTFLASGYKGVYELRSTADEFEWFVPFLGGKVRYTTKLGTNTCGSSQHLEDVSAEEMRNRAPYHSCL